MTKISRMTKRTLNSKKREKILNFVSKLSTRERYLELKRQMLCSSHKFQPYMMYKTLCQTGANLANKTITAASLAAFLTKTTSKKPDMALLSAITDHYSRNPSLEDKPELTFAGFLSMILPKNNQSVRAYVTQKEYQEASESARVSPASQEAMAELIEENIDFFKDIEALVAKFTSVGLSSVGIIEEICACDLDVIQKGKIIDFEILSRFLEKCDLLLEDYEVENFMRVVDKKQHGLITQKDLESFLRRISDLRLLEPVYAASGGGGRLACSMVVHGDSQTEIKTSLRLEESRIGNSAKIQKMLKNSEISLKESRDAPKSSNLREDRLSKSCYVPNSAKFGRNRTSFVRRQSRLMIKTVASEIRNSIRRESSVTRRTSERPEYSKNQDFEEESQIEETELDERSSWVEGSDSDQDPTNETVDTVVITSTRFDDENFRKKVNEENSEKHDFRARRGPSGFANTISKQERLTNLYTKLHRSKDMRFIQKIEKHKKVEKVEAKITDLPKANQNGHHGAAQGRRKPLGELLTHQNSRRPTSHSNLRLSSKSQPCPPEAFKNSKKSTTKLNQTINSPETRLEVTQMDTFSNEEYIKKTGQARGLETLRRESSLYETELYSSNSEDSSEGQSSRLRTSPTFKRPLTTRRSESSQEDESCFVDTRASLEAPLDRQESGAAYQKGLNQHYRQNEWRPSFESEKGSDDSTPSLCSTNEKYLTTESRTSSQITTTNVSTVEIAEFNPYHDSGPETFRDNFQQGDTPKVAFNALGNCSELPQTSEKVSRIFFKRSLAKSKIEQKMQSLELDCIAEKVRKLLNRRIMLEDYKITLFENPDFSIEKLAGLLDQSQKKAPRISLSAFEKGLIRLGIQGFENLDFIKKVIKQSETDPNHVILGHSELRRVFYPTVSVNQSTKIFQTFEQKKFDESVLECVEKILNATRVYLSAVETTRQFMSAQISRLKELFEKFDLGGSGLLSIKEFAEIVNSGGFRYSEDDINLIFIEIDANFDGFVSFQDLSVFLAGV